MYITLHTITLHCVTLRYVTLLYIAYHTLYTIHFIPYITYVTLHTLHTLHTLYYITLHYIALHCIALNHITLHDMTLHTYITYIHTLHEGIHICIYSLGHSSQSHAHVWDRCSRRRVFREREDRIKMTEQDQAEAWNEHTSKQTQGVCPVSTSMVGHRPWREATHQQPRRLPQLIARKLAGKH